jgi:DNA invertase Pin-like site-specific DNA recombinase
MNHVNHADHDKVTAQHLQRTAYLYIRQSSLRQVLENSESTKRQYALRERAVALGWPLERIVVIDGDQGQSGASAADRVGFQTLVAEVGLGHVGIVLGLEVSRLARNNSDWHRLLEICALTDTLILDEDGVYDPSAFNDRLLLGLKGAMSEAELHVLRARLRGGILNKARRGALKLPLPIGFAYREDEQVIRDPDQQVQQAVRLFFETFRRTGSASGIVRSFREAGLNFPHHVRSGPHCGEVYWGPLLHSTALHLLHNPRYAGVFVFGRTRTALVEGRVRVRILPREQWTVLYPQAHEAYISLEEYEQNQRQLSENAQAHAQAHTNERVGCPAREGAALLQGLVICGRCGEQMTLRYHQRRGRLVPDYVCQSRTIQQGRTPCQVVPGGVVDVAIGELLVAAITPEALEVALAVQAEVVARAEEADRLRCQQVERARYEAELAQRRYMRVDPENRLVADVLEAEWNSKLRLLAKAQEEAEQQRQAAQVPSRTQREAVLKLARDVPRLWYDERTPDRERKRMVRLMISDVTLLKGEQIVAQVRFRGGRTTTVQIPKPKSAVAMRPTERGTVEEIDRLLEDYTDGEVASELNARGWHSRDGKRFHGALIGKLRRSHQLKDHYERLRERGLLTGAELARRFNVSGATVKCWRRRGLLRAERGSDKGEWLYYVPEAGLPAKWQRKRGHEKLYTQTANGGAV